MRTANQWIDPETGFTYDWPVNHLEEQPMNKTRQMGDGAPTGNIGLVPQQGPATPLILSWKGTMFDDAQHQMNLTFWQTCEDHSVYIKDFTGAKYEVIITDYDPSRKSVARNPKFPDKKYIYEYTLTMRVIKVHSGPYAGVTP